MESEKRLLGFCKTIKGDKPKSQEELEARANLRGYQFSQAQLDTISEIYVVKEKTILKLPKDSSPERGSGRKEDGSNN